MVTQKLRLFKGSTELNYASCTIKKTNDHIINKADIGIENNPNVTNSSVIDFKQVDGSTTIFSAKVEEIKEIDLWLIKTMTNGFELNNIKVEQVYTNTSPEAIVQDVFDTYMPGLTFGTLNSSGITLNKYVANAYGIDVVKDMMDILRWQLTIDETDVGQFEPPGNTDNGKTFTNGGSNGNIDITSWIEDKNEMFNKVKVIGGFESFLTSETITDSSTTFTLSNKPTGTLKATVSGTEVDPTTYVVAAEDKEVTFDASKTNPTFDYSFSLPVVVNDQDDDSISVHTERFREVQAPWLNTVADARRYASKLIDSFSSPLVKAKGTEATLNFTQEVGELVTVTDNVRDKSALLVITKITLDAVSNTTKYEFGPRDFLLYDWQREVQERIKKIERRFINTDVQVFSRLFKSELDISLVFSEDLKRNWPVDSFIAGHESLSRARADLNFEPDCSNNDHNGTWSGTGITGNQYDVDGWRLSSGIFNGSDRIITVSDHADLDLDDDFTIMFSIKVDAIPGSNEWLLKKWDDTDGWTVRLNSTGTLTLFYENSDVTSSINTDSTITAKTWTHIAFVKNGTALTVYIDGVEDNTATGNAAGMGTNNEDLIIGNHSTTYFDGELDEIRLYDDNLSAATVLSVYNRINETTNLVGYWSMDNSRAGDRSSPKVIHVDTDEFKLDLSSDDADDDSTAYWDTANKRIAMSQSDNHLVVYNTMANTGKIWFTGKSFATATLTATEVIWGNDVVKYFLTNDAGDTIGEVFNGTAFTFPALENDLRIRVAFMGNGGIETYVYDVQVEVTRT